MNSPFVDANRQQHFVDESKCTAASGTMKKSQMSERLGSHCTLDVWMQCSMATIWIIRKLLLGWCLTQECTVKMAQKLCCGKIYGWQWSDVVGRISETRDLDQVQHQQPKCTGMLLTIGCRECAHSSTAWSCYAYFIYVQCSYVCVLCVCVRDTLWMRFCWWANVRPPARRSPAVLHSRPTKKLLKLIYIEFVCLFANANDRDMQVCASTNRMYALHYTRRANAHMWRERR